MEMDHFSLKNKTKQKKQTHGRGDGSVSKRFLSKRKGGHELHFQHPHGGEVETGGSLGLAEQSV